MITPRPGVHHSRCLMLYLVRHAHSKYSPDEMRDLSPAGHADARRVADLLERSDISRIVSSPYTRARQTVEPLAERLGLPIQIDADLRERLLCTEVLDDFTRPLEKVWQDFDLSLPGGESSAAAQARVRGAIERIVAGADGRGVAVASHGNALALFLRTLDPSVDYAFWVRMSTPDVYRVDLRGGREWTYRRIWTPS
jgi:2,3-bisphosphoglycerate-dependent phosphoglycerate mutase